MTRRAVETIEGVAAHQFEESAILLLQGADDLELLGWV